MRLQLLLPLTLFLFLTSFARSQEPTYWDDHADISWWESARSRRVYTITTAEELAGVAWLTNNQHTMFIDITIALANDIDLSAHYWVPIGGDQNPFCGNFDGGNNTIKGMKVGAGESANYQYAGLFGVVVAHCNSFIKDLTIEEGVVQVRSQDFIYAAGLAGYVYTAENYKLEISHCTSSVSVQGEGITKNKDSLFSAGGIVGFYMGIGNLFITECTNNGAVTGGAVVSEQLGDMHTGGILGFVYMADTLEITGCTNNAPITGGMNAEYSYTGGIVGYSLTMFAEGIHFSDNLNTGTIRGGDLSEVSKGRSDTGGIVGAGSARITGCTNKGEVLGGKATGKALSCTGGIVGFIYSVDNRLEGCVNEGMVTLGETDHPQPPINDLMGCKEDVYP